MRISDWSSDVCSSDLFPVTRVILQDAAGLPLLADLAALRDAAAKAGQDPAATQSVIPFALVVDHSVQIDSYGTSEALQLNLDRELDRNEERYGFLKIGRASCRERVCQYV